MCFYVHVIEKLGLDDPDCLLLFLLLIIIIFYLAIHFPSIPAFNIYILVPGSSVSVSTCIGCIWYNIGMAIWVWDLNQIYLGHAQIYYIFMVK